MIRGQTYLRKRDDGSHIELSELVNLLQEGLVTKAHGHGFFLSDAAHGDGAALRDIVSINASVGKRD